MDAPGRSAAAAAHAVGGLPLAAVGQRLGRLSVVVPVVFEAMTRWGETVDVSVREIASVTGLLESEVRDAFIALESAGLAESSRFRPTAAGLAARPRVADD